MGDYILRHLRGNLIGNLGEVCSTWSGEYANTTTDSTSITITGTNDASDWNAVPGNYITWDSSQSYIDMYPPFFNLTVPVFTVMVNSLLSYVFIRYVSYCSKYDLDKLTMKLLAEIEKLVDDIDSNIIPVKNPTDTFTLLPAYMRFVDKLYAQAPIWDTIPAFESFFTGPAVSGKNRIMAVLTKELDTNSRYSSFPSAEKKIIYNVMDILLKKLNFI